MNVTQARKFGKRGFGKIVTVYKVNQAPDSLQVVTYDTFLWRRRLDGKERDTKGSSATAAVNAESQAELPSNDAATKQLLIIVWEGVSVLQELLAHRGKNDQM